MKSAKSLIVLTGKTTSGKDTVASKLQQKFPNLKKILTTTSRPPRNSETNGIDYDFLSEDKFKQKITEGDFIEHVEYGGNLYGTQKCQIANNLGHDLIWRIDPSRAGKVREFIKDSFDQSRADDLLKRIVVIYLTVSD
ncbi:MAG: Guanylate kinase [Candidatus Daviesbacteria bacterium GW2011_GWF2_38_7]|nr:MAG: Guanylate kinase [Candidatus Daviesbacteria bacterium GW2011_GWF2_38_7]